ncbi:hypothetical protein KU75_16095 [Pectobacterium odoriferum]|uniref:DUF2303 family protein n=1 Tax=Pectobacterium odoriferum TaxID=78398 RepID=A0ABR4VN15_9GAMM|nr:DUF2303 family protein [Pectobacterium odoriferum]KGA40740.1 hypothetical protein KU75_16095 [Pectobacterium odoriferum]
MSSQVVDGSAVSEIRNLAIAAHTPNTYIPTAVVPDSHSVESLEDYQLTPSLIRQNVNLISISSLIAYVKKYEDPRTAIFADNTKTKVVAVLDYHKAPDLPEWGKHKALYNCPFSKEWLAWATFDGKARSQVDFGEFIENHIGDIAAVSDTYVGPSGVELLEMVLEFQETRTSEFKSVKRLHDGTTQFAYSDEKSGAGNTKLPEKISLAIAPFHNGNTYQVDARFRYRIKEGQLILWYELIDPEKIVEHAFSEIVTELQTAFENVPIYEGSI